MPNGAPALVAISSPEEIDQNFYDVEQRLEAVEQNPVLPNEIEFDLG